MRRRNNVKQVLEIASHRNGVSGEPFHAVRFVDNSGSLNVAVVFSEAGLCAVLDVEPLSRDGGVEFGRNSWRGDYF